VNNSAFLIIYEGYFIDFENGILIYLDKITQAPTTE